MSRRKLRGPGLAMLVLLCPPPAAAQETRIEAHDLPRNAEYEREIALSRIQHDMTYVRAHDGPLPLQGLEPPDPSVRQASAEPSPALRLGGRLLLVLLVLALVALAIRNRTLLFAGPRGPAATRARGIAGAAEAVEIGPGVEILDRLRGLSDRRAALAELIGAALAAAARQNGLRLGRSETARDFLRRLPRDWPHRQSLQALVMTEELVQFGGRALPEQTFALCLDRARPILREAEG